jgi:pimeloyl-ACP methyl ester carboxylesterase
MTETIFMIHGMGCNGSSWDKYQSFFEGKGYRCITPTLRFHDMAPTGTPDPRLGITSLLDYIDDLKKEIEKLDQVPIIMGHSMGGLLAQILGSQGFGKALVLLTPGAPHGIKSLSGYFYGIKTFWSVLRRPGFWKKPFRLTFNEVTYSALQLLSLEEQKKEYSKLVYESGRVLNEMSLELFGQNRASIIDESKITVPVLIIGGSMDKMTPAPLLRKIAKRYGDRCTYKEFTGHSHWVIGEPNWQDVANFVNEWLNQQLGKSE